MTLIIVLLVGLTITLGSLGYGLKNMDEPWSVAPGVFGIVGSILLLVCIPFAIIDHIKASDQRRDLEGQHFEVISVSGDEGPQARVKINNKTYDCELKHEEDVWFIASTKSCKEIKSTYKNAARPEDWESQ